MAIEKSNPVPPFVSYCAALIPTVFDDSLSYYEALCALSKWLQDNLVNVVNNNADVTESYIKMTEEMKTYMDNYFDNLDVQDEINNKLDAMVEAGTLQEIITTYIQSNVAWTFDTVADMKNATNFVAGSYAQTLGFYAVNDGGGAMYIISDTGTANEMDVIAVGDLYATLVTLDDVNVKKFGAHGDGSTDDTTFIQRAIDYMSARNGGIVTIPESTGAYIFTEIVVKEGITLKCTGGVLKLKSGTCVSSETKYYLVHNLVENSGYDNVTFDSLIIDCNKANQTAALVADGITVIGSNCVIKDCYIYNTFDSGIMFSRVTNSQCINNRIDGAGDCGIYINDGTGSDAYENIVSGNRITNSVASGIALKRISQRFIVTNNAIYTAGYGITFERASTDSDFSLNSIVADNEIRDAAVGIQMQSSDYVAISGNRIENCQTGINLTGLSRYCNISSNVISGASSGTITYRGGIMIGTSAVGTPSYNTIVGNTINMPASYGIYAIDLAHPADQGKFNIISNNTIISGSNNAIRVSALYTLNLITGNMLNGTTYDILFDSSTTGNKTDANWLVNGTSLNLDDNKLR